VWKNSPEESSAPAAEPDRREERKPSTQRVASLGPSLVIRGTLSGQEDLLIEGQVEGEISLRKHSVTVGPKGRVKADIFSKSICIEGEVQGNLFGEDQVTIRRSGRVRGNVTSPRVSLEDGSRFKGAIDMKAPPPATDAAGEDPVEESGGTAGKPSEAKVGPRAGDRRGRAIAQKS